ncbi:MAG TPA: hypothetical protein VG755_41860 [Nannocystaceae bacterium]|nr:hypothetical protein [Nannocystaceae bacterium]
MVLAFAACDTKGDEAKSKTETKKAESKTPAKADAKAAEAKAGDAKADAKVDAKADEAKADEAKAGDAKADAAPPAAPPAPATAEEAANQLAAWLEAPATAGVPPLLAAAGDIEVAEFCGACDDTKKPKKTNKLTGVDAMTKKADELRKAAAQELISAEEKLECKDDCCKFIPEPGIGVPDTVVNIETICVALDKDKKPTAYTKLETSGSM